jgi:hypothetical protein
VGCAAALRASNEVLLPPPVALDVDLRGVACAADVRLLGEETRLKVAMLAADRRVIALLFDCTSNSEAVARQQLVACDVVRASLGDRGHGLRMLLSAELKDSSPPLPYTADGHDIEYALVVDTDVKPAALVTALGALRSDSARPPAPARSEVWLTRSHGAARPGFDDELLSIAAQASDAVTLTLLAIDGPGHGDEDRRLYASMAARLEDLGLQRRAPCRYQRSASRRSCIASLLSRFPHLDVLGIGPGAVSHVQAQRFVNYDSVSAYRAALAGSQDAIESSSVLSNAELLVAEISSKLVAGVGLEITSLLDACSMRTPRFVTALRACLDDFERRGLLSADVSGRLFLCAVADGQLSALVEELQALLPVPDGPNVIRLRSQ